jgi:hypothetical protein
MKTHGLSKHELYSVWLGMKQRCADKNHISYHNYGQKGIKVCDKWANSFESFLEDMGERPQKGMSIERIDSNKDYEPNNCKWATRVEQNRNRNNNMCLTYNGVTKTIIEWESIVNIKYTTLRRRINLGWNVDKIFNTKPIIGNNQHKVLA